MADLARYVVVGGVTYGPGSDVPAEVAKQITNPKAWAHKPASAPAKKVASSTPDKK